MPAQEAIEGQNASASTQDVRGSGLSVVDGSPAPERLEWLTTAPNPRSRPTGFDAGQRGWRMHAVRVKSGEKMKDIRFREAACGLVAGHGWGLDLFIDTKCQRCERALAKQANIAIRHGEDGHTRSRES